MSDRSLVPRSIVQFNIFLLKTTAYLLAGTPTNWSRFGWTAAEIAQWQGFLAQWIPLYTAYSDKKGQRTTGIKDQLYTIIAACVALCKNNHLLLSIQATRSVSVTDLETFNLPATDVTGETAHHVTARTAATVDLVYPTLKPVGGGMIRCKCFTEAAKSGRAHKLKGFDLVEFRYVVVTAATATVPAVIPTDPESAALTSGDSSKASFLLPTGTANSGKLLCIFFRWTNSKHPELDGPWSTCFTSPIF